MNDFTFLKNSVSGKWVVLAPRRAKRPNVAKGTEAICPFCPGREKDEEEVYRVPSVIASEAKQSLPAGRQGQADGIATDSSSPRNDKYEWPASNASRSDAGWQIRIIPNKFPFAPIHEIIIHSPDHHKNIDELPESQVELLLQTYRQRYQAHADQGQVYIFHNRGIQGGESLPHPHTQLAVVPEEVKMDIPSFWAAEFDLKTSPHEETEQFYIHCPKTSQWSDEVWISPKKEGSVYGEIADMEIKDLAKTLQTLIHIFDLRHGQEFPFNFYIYPRRDWYLRLIPRAKTLGGFEVGTGIFVNTQDPSETIAFIKEHFKNPDLEAIKKKHAASYHRAV